MAEINQNSNNLNIVIVSAYMHEADAVSPEELYRLIRFCGKNEWELIISTDTNTHHQLWGMDSSNSKGNSLLEYLLSTNLDIIKKVVSPPLLAIDKQMSNL